LRKDERMHFAEKIIRYGSADSSSKILISFVNFYVNSVYIIISPEFRPEPILSVRFWDPDPYFFSCWIWIQILNTDPDPDLRVWKRLLILGKSPQAMPFEKFLLTLKKMLLEKWDQFVYRNVLFFYICIIYISERVIFFYTCT